MWVGTATGREDILPAFNAEGGGGVALVMVTEYRVSACEWCDHCQAWAYGTTWAGEAHMTLSCARCGSVRLSVPLRMWGPPVGVPATVEAPPKEQGRLL